MKYFWITFIFLFGLVTTIEVWTAEQSMHLPDGEIEKFYLKRVKGATREDEVLKLQTNAGAVTFKDRINAGEGSAKYYLAGLSGIHNNFYLILLFGYETKGYVIVSRNTGQTINLYSVPLFSPDGERFVDVSLDLDSGYMPNLILIYKLNKRKYTVEWKYEYQGMKGPSSPVWLDNSTIVFFEVTVKNISIRPKLIKKPYIIEWKNEKWNLPRLLR